MSKDKKSDDILELKNILTDFIVEQRNFNKEQMIFNKEQIIFNKEQKEFNIKIDKKIDRIEYSLEEGLAKNTLALFQEYDKMSKQVKKIDKKVTEIDHEVINLKSNLYDISLKINPLKVA